MITIYESESEIADKVKNNSLAFQLTPEVVDCESEFKVTAQANPNQIDLFYLKSILVSVGWNGNDDVFDKQEVYAACKTPIDKQFNFMHNEKDIIGHITSTKIFDGETTYDDIDIKDLPDKFDIIVGSVIYKKWTDEKLQKRMNKLIAEIKDNKWFVSMECLFRDFDYAVVSTDGEKIVARNQETAFLSKYLRAYGGPGEFKGQKIGRVLRSFAFSGKGLVDKPANKRSLIIDYSDFSEDQSVAMENIMSSSITQEQYEQVLSKLALAEQKLGDMNDQSKSKELNDLKVQVASLTESNQSLQAKITTLQSEVSVSSEVAQNKDSQITALTKERDEALASVKAHLETLKVVELEKTKAARLAQLSTKDVANDRALALVEKFITISDEMFAEVVASLADKKTQEVKTEKQDKSVAKVLLDEYELDGFSVSTASADSQESQELRTKASSWLKTCMNKKGE
jgi:ABC-type branched-subunit amino acid transport system ATPase component